MPKTIQNSRKLSLRRGVAAVEAAVCLPILVLVMLGALEVSSGIFQEFNVQSCAYEFSKVALRSGSSCTDVQLLADELMPQFDFSTYSIQIDVIPRTVNADTVEPAQVTSFSIPQSGSAPAGLEDIPRGTLLRLTVTADRPAIAGQGFTRSFLNGEISSDCVFVKEF